MGTVTMGLRQQLSPACVPPSRMTYPCSAKQHSTASQRQSAPSSALASQSFDRVLILHLSSVISCCPASHPSSILNLLCSLTPTRRLERPERRRQRATIPAVVAGWSPQPKTIRRPEPNRRFGGPLPEVASRAGALLVRALPAPRDPASHPRAAVPIWSHPTVSDSLSGLPLTDARMPRLNLGEP